jgi:hypothetical protein
MEVNIMGYTTEIGEYKGHPTISIFEDGYSKFPVVSFGTNKAKAILASVEDIEAFIASKSKEVVQNEP